VAVAGALARQRRQEEEKEEKAERRIKRKRRRRWRRRGGVACERMTSFKSTVAMPSKGLLASMLIPKALFSS